MIKISVINLVLTKEGKLRRNVSGFVDEIPQGIFSPYYYYYYYYKI